MWLLLQDFCWTAMVDSTFHFFLHIYSMKWTEILWSFGVLEIPDSQNLVKFESQGTSELKIKNKMRWLSSPAES